MLQGSYEGFVTFSPGMDVSASLLKPCGPASALMLGYDLQSCVLIPRSLQPSLRICTDSSAC